MKVYRKGKDDAAVVFEEIEPFFIDMLRELPEDSDPGSHPAACARIFSAPMSNTKDVGEFLDDWQSLIEPEIRQLFQSAREIVEGDLEKLPKMALPTETGDDELPFNPVAFTPSEHSLTIAANHMDAWLRVLNQARLVLAARHGFDEEAMTRERTFPPFTCLYERDMFKVNFYDEIQQLLMQEMGYG